MKFITSIIDNILAKADKPYIFCFCAVLELLIYVGDAVTGPFINFSFFYLIPIGIMAWYVGKHPAYILAIVSGLTTSHIRFIGFPRNVPLQYLVYDTLAESILFLLFSFICVQLRSQIATLEGLRITDKLTGLRSKRSFALACDVELNRTRRFDQPMSIIMLKIQNVRFNDSAEVSDELEQVLNHFISRISSALNGGDILGRYAINTLCILFPQTDGERAKTIVDNINDNLIKGNLNKKSLFHGPAVYDMIALTCNTSIPNEFGVEQLFSILKKMTRNNGYYDDCYIKYAVL